MQSCLQLEELRRGNTHTISQAASLTTKWEISFYNVCVTFLICNWTELHNGRNQKTLVYMASHVYVVSESVLYVDVGILLSPCNMRVYVCLF